MSGILVTADFWFTWQIVHAQFVQFIAGDGESWGASFEVSVSSPATFQFEESVTTWEGSIQCQESGIRMGGR